MPTRRTGLPDCEPIARLPADDHAEGRRARPLSQNLFPIDVSHEDLARANLALPDPEGTTPLFILPPDNPDLAAAVTRILLAYGADAGWCNANGRTPIDVARDQDFHEAAALMEAGIAPG